MTVSGYINFETANVFNTVIIPIRMRFHLLQEFKHWLKGSIFDCMLLFPIPNLLLWKTIPSAVADIDVQWMFFSGQNITLCFLNDPIRSTVHLDFNPDSLPNCSSVVIRFSNDLFVPYNGKLASSATRGCFISTLFIFIPLMFLFLSTIIDTISIQTMNK